MNGGEQDLDYSCGAAALATLLSEYYRQPVSEAELLKGDGQRAMAGHRLMICSVPFAGVWLQGAGLCRELCTAGAAKMPVVYLKHRKDDHFSVLRGIDGNTVWLADPSLGNRSYSREQFL